MQRTNEYYIGCTGDLRKRLAQHNNGDVNSTKRYVPWKLEYYEAFSDHDAAWRREAGLKNNGNSMRELKKRIGSFGNKESGKGFTLVEILVVFGIMAIISSIAATV